MKSALFGLAASAAVLFSMAAMAGDKPVHVNVENFGRVETDMQISRMLKMAGGVNKWTINREPTPLDKQNVIRMNRDTLYSFAIVDISKGATISMPDPGKRYQSMMIVNNDGYINKVFYGGGDFELTMEEFDTPYVVAAVRTLADASDEEDVKKANALQDKMKIKAGGSTPFVMPDYDMKSYEATYKPLLELAKGVPNTHGMFGSKADVNPMLFTIGSAFGWGGLPEKDAFYLNVDPGLPVGAYEINVKDVPVDGFWSISVYDKEGYFKKNALNSYSLNNLTAKPNKDGSFTIRLGECTEETLNCIPLTEGWNYAVRLYRPGEAILDGSWTFPSAVPVKK